MLDKGPFAEQLRKERRAAKAAADTLICAAETNDIEKFAEALEALEYNSDGWKRVLRKAKTCKIHPDFRSTFLTLWEHAGDTLRSKINNDLLLLDLLREFLPAYTGPALELFRGETAWNRRRRTYGMAWSADREAAACFAGHRDRRASMGGSVLVRTVAPSEAIICAPHVLGARRPAEAEYIVDRRRLTDVTVLERFAQTPLIKNSEAARHAF